METAIMKAEDSQAVLASVVDSRLTRTEILDLIVERVSRELQAEERKLEIERDEVDASFPLSAALKLAKAAPHVSVRLERNWNRESEILKIAFDLTPGMELPKKYLEAKAKRAALETRVREVRAQRQRLGAGKVRARNEMVHQALASSPEGAKILEAIDTLKEQVRARLVQPELKQERT